MRTVLFGFAVLAGRVLAAAMVTAAVLWAPAPALACDGPGSEPLNVLLAGPDRPEGLYELTIVARAPALLLRGQRSATVVTRSWGPAPDNTGVVIQGDQWGLLTGLLGGSFCGPGVGESDHFYQAVYRPDPERPRTLVFPVLAVAGSQISDAESEALAAALGPATTYGISATDRVQAHVRLWWAPVLVVGLLTWGLSRLRRAGARAD